jgi:hypothetical protein
LTGSIALADAIKDMRALSKLFFGGDEDDYGNSYAPVALEVGMTEADLSNKNLRAGGAIIVAAWISHKDKGAMTRLNLSKNGLLTQEGGRALGNMLKANTILKELDISDSGNGMHSSQKDGPGFATAISEGLASNGALSVANCMGNAIGKEQLSKLQEIMRSKPNLISLCGIADDATAADLSGLGLDADDAAIILASELPNKRAMTSLDFGNNNFGGYSDYRGFHATPEGKPGILMCVDSL